MNKELAEALEFLKKKRYFVFFTDGTWRTCDGNLWGEEQVYKLKPVATGWAGGEFDVKVIEAVITRFTERFPA